MKLIFILSLLLGNIINATEPVPTDLVKSSASGSGNGGDERFENAIDYADHDGKKLDDAFVILQENVIKMKDLHYDLKYPKKFLDDFSKQLTVLKNKNRIQLLKGVDTIVVEFPNRESSKVVANSAFTFPNENSNIYLSSKSMDYNAQQLAEAIADEVPEQILPGFWLRRDDDLANSIGHEISNFNVSNEMAKKMREIYHIDQSYLHDDNEYALNILALAAIKINYIYQTVHIRKKHRKHLTKEQLLSGSRERVIINKVSDSLATISCFEYLRNIGEAVRAINEYTIGKYGVEIDTEVIYVGQRRRCNGDYSLNFNHIVRFSDIVNLIDKAKKNRYKSNIVQIRQLSQNIFTQISGKVPRKHYHAIFKNYSSHKLTQKFYQYVYQTPGLDILSGHEELFKKTLEETCPENGLFTMFSRINNKKTDKIRATQNCLERAVSNTVLKIEGPKQY